VNSPCAWDTFYGNCGRPDNAAAGVHDAELEHERAIREGISPDTDLFVAARDTRKLNDDDKLQADRIAAIRERSRDDRDSTSTQPS
jgi:hypothetical protein